MEGEKCYVKSIFPPNERKGSRQNYWRHDLLIIPGFKEEETKIKKMHVKKIAKESQCHFGITTTIVNVFQLKLHMFCL